MQKMLKVVCKRFRDDPSKATALAYAKAAKACFLKANAHAAIAVELESAGYKDAMLHLMR